jgi:predicted AlkP superfamily pyrophosphatase or phosphodiesterase
MPPLFKSALRTTAAALIGLAAPAAAEAPLEQPRLLVAISVDQFSAGLFDQYRGRFRHGLKRLIDEGAVFPNGYQSHAATETCPGHSTLLTGRHPSATGIIGNGWIDRVTGKSVYCVEDGSVIVPGRPTKPLGPAHLRVSTLGEWLRARDPASRTVAVSGKDRGAITMAGQDPTAVFWWDEERGFNTYVKPGESEAERLAPVVAFNAGIDKAWRKAPPAWAPVDASCAALNGLHGYATGHVIDHRVPPAWTRDASKPLREDQNFQVWFRASPMLDRLTLDLAGQLLDRFALGRRGSTDLLALSLSATDYIGHRYGNQGPEMCDQLAHLDRALGAFLKRLDRLNIPYAVMLTADHGAADAAERTAERGAPAQRISLDLPTALNAWLRTRLAIGYDAFKGDAQNLVLDPGTLVAADRERILAAALEGLRDTANPSLPWAGLVVTAFTREEAMATKVPPDKPADELNLIERYAESVDAERSPDIMVALAPFASIGKPRPPENYIAGHGSPWSYDRRVPILFWRSGGRPFEQSLPVETVDIAPTLAALVGLAPPATDGTCRDLDPGAGSSCP